MNTTVEDDETFPSDQGSYLVCRTQNPAALMAMSRLRGVNLLMWFGGISCSPIIFGCSSIASHVGTVTISRPPGRSSAWHNLSTSWKDAICSSTWNIATTSKDAAWHRVASPRFGKTEIPFCWSSALVVSLASTANALPLTPEVFKKYSLSCANFE